MHPINAEYIRQLEEQIKQQAAMIERMREYFELIKNRFCGWHTVADEALALQPCPEVLNKVRADAVRKAFKLMMDGRWRGDALNVLADRMEQGEA